MEVDEESSESLEMMTETPLFKRDTFKPFKLNDSVGPGPESEQYTDLIRGDRLEYPIKQIIPKSNLTKINKLISKVPEEKEGGLNFKKTLGNLIFSSNNPF